MAVMWEARAADGRLADLVAFADAHADPSAALYQAQVPEPRVVLIDPTGHGVPEPPAELCSRPPHMWHFAPVARSRPDEGAAG